MAKKGMELWLFALRSHQMDFDEKFLFIVVTWDYPMPRRTLPNRQWRTHGEAKNLPGWKIVVGNVAIFDDKFPDKI